MKNELEQTVGVRSAKYHENGEVEIELSQTALASLKTTPSTSRYNQISRCCVIYKLMRGEAFGCYLADQFREWLGKRL